VVGELGLRFGVGEAQGATGAGGAVPVLADRAALPLALGGGVGDESGVGVEVELGVGGGADGGVAGGVEGWGGEEEEEWEEMEGGAWGAAWVGVTLGIRGGRHWCGTP